MLNNLFGRKQHEAIPASALEQTLRQVARKLPGLHWAAVVSANGLIQEMYDPFGKTDPDRASAMAAAALSLGERISHELQHGQLTYSITAGDEGLFIVHSIGKAYALAISLPTKTKVSAAVDALARAVATLTE